MEIFPAIDLKRGKCVRLTQGDFAQEIVFSDSPVDQAMAFKSAGFKYLHIVDLDGALSGDNTNFREIEKIIQSTGMSVQVGGGIRTLESAEKYFAIGVDRVIIGTIAITNPELFRSIATKHPKKIILGLDVRNGYVAVNGWVEDSAILASDLLAKMNDLELFGVVCTDILKDGMMLGPNFDFTAGLMAHSKHKIIASGGVSCLQDLQLLHERKIFGAIVGKAIYTNAISVDDLYNFSAK